MARIEFEIDDKGDIVGDTPPDVENYLKRVYDRGHVAGYGTGREESAKEAKKQIEMAVTAEKLRLERELPFERERLASLEEDSKNLRRQAIERERDAERLLREREEKHAKDMLERSDKLKQRETQIEKLLMKTLRSEAGLNGARDESLPELEVILKSQIGYDENMEPFVKDEDGRAKIVGGVKQTIESFVKQYLDSHPHHRKAQVGRGGGARAGASLTGTPPGSLSAEAAGQRIDQGDHSPEAINDFFMATRKKSA